MKLQMLQLMCVFTFLQAENNFHSFEMEDIRGNSVKLEDYRGKVVLLVNTASKCGLTRQYAELVELMKQYEGKEFVVLGFPANNFMNQEPGTNEDILMFCEEEYNVNFPMFGKVSVRGRDIHPLFAWLTKTENPDFTGDVGWNFEKFLIGPDGQLVRRFRSRVKPSDQRVLEAINELL